MPRKNKDDVMISCVRLVVSVFVLVGGVIFSDHAFSDGPRLRNCPAVILVLDATGERKHKRQMSPFSAGAAEELRDELSARLPRARITTSAGDRADIERESKLQKEETEEFGKDESGRRALERSETFVRSLGLSGDFIVILSLDALGAKYVLSAAVFENETWTSLMRTQRIFDDIDGGLSGAATEIAAEVADELKDSFYCVDAEPEELRTEGDKAGLTARVVNLVNEPVEDETTNFKTAKPEAGTMDPDAVPLKDGEAKTRYIVQKRVPNSVKIMVKPKEEPARRVITNGLSVPVVVDFVLEFSGYSRASYDMPIEGGDISGAFKTSISDGRIPLEIDYKSGTVKGTGTCFMEGSGEGMFSSMIPGYQTKGEDRGSQEKREATVKVSGKISGELLCLALSLESMDLSYKGGMQSDAVVEVAGGSPETYHASMGMSLEKGKVTYDTPAGQIEFPLENEESKAVIGPIIIPMEDGAKANPRVEKNMPNTPVEGMRQYYRFEFVLKERKDEEGY